MLQHASNLIVVVERVVLQLYAAGCYLVHLGVIVIYMPSGDKHVDIVHRALAMIASATPTTNTVCGWNTCRLPAINNRWTLTALL